MLGQITKFQRSGHKLVWSNSRQQNKNPSDKKDKTKNVEKTVSIDIRGLFLYVYAFTANGKPNSKRRDALCIHAAVCQSVRPLTTIFA